MISLPLAKISARSQSSVSNLPSFIEYLVLGTADIVIDKMVMVTVLLEFAFW